MVFCLLHLPKSGFEFRVFSKIQSRSIRFFFSGSLPTIWRRVSSSRRLWWWPNWLTERNCVVPSQSAGQIQKKKEWKKNQPIGQLVIETKRKLHDDATLWRCGGCYIIITRFNQTFFFFFSFFGYSRRFWIEQSVCAIGGGKENGTITRITAF